MKYSPIALSLFFWGSLGLGTANAQGVMFEYFATLSPRDTYSSEGVALNSVCAIVQQDRANVHRFGNPDGEEPDPFFTTSERRAMIQGKCDYDRTHHTVDRIRNRVIGFVFVRVYGSGGQVSRVEIQEAAG
ncbi:hypothetical protein [Palleronia abyssalis]|uniref:DUF3828 domain-containing protein n=1 Tax=Palleronia abyssalis TaxID=1501240 RepID=A0A2R8BVR0_9RHOB|nr:hypothetical protein [Palleronia abyssalis]SPJ24244.1 hypothetical protein PAA8504_02072 [Palleronia abyssalis]